MKENGSEQKNYWDVPGVKGIEKKTSVSESRKPAKKNDVKGGLSGKIA